MGDSTGLKPKEVHFSDLSGNVPEKPHSQHVSLFDLTQSSLSANSPLPMVFIEKKKISVKCLILQLP